MSKIVTIQKVGDKKYSLSDNASSRVLNFNRIDPVGPLDSIPFGNPHKIGSYQFHPFIGVVNYPPPYQTKSEKVAGIDAGYEIEQIQLIYDEALNNVTVLVTLNKSVKIVQSSENVNVDLCNNRFEYLRLDFDNKAAGCANHTFMFNVEKLKLDQVVSLIIAIPDKNVSTCTPGDPDTIIGAGYNSIFNFKITL